MDAATVKVLKARVASFERELLRPVRLKIELLAGDKTVGLLAAPLLIDRTAAFAAYHQLDFLSDYEVEVAQEARIADPVRDFAYGGMFANVKVSPAGARNYRLRLDLRVAAMDAIRAINPAAGGFGSLQSVPVRTRHVRTMLDLAPGRPKTIDLGRNPYAPDKPGRLIARVSVD